MLEQGKVYEYDFDHPRKSESMPKNAIPAKIQFKRKWTHFEAQVILGIAGSALLGFAYWISDQNKSDFLGIVTFMCTLIGILFLIGIPAIFAEYRKK